MNIPNQFPQIGVFLADNLFVPILEEVPVAFVPPIETDRIPGKQSSHQARKGHRPRAEKKVSVIWHQDGTTRTQKTAFELREGLACVA